MVPILLGAHLNSGWSPGELTRVSGLQVPTTGIFPLFHPPGLHLESVHLDYNRHIYFNCIVLYLIVSNNNKMKKKKVHYGGIEPESTQMDHAVL
jgi:hypothetical protein